MKNCVVVVLGSTGTAGSGAVRACLEPISQITVDRLGHLRQLIEPFRRPLVGVPCGRIHGPSFCANYEPGENVIESGTLTFDFFELIQ